MSENAEIGLSRKQRVFAVLEDVFGTLQLPSGTTDFIRPAGNAVISQNPAFNDSEELANTLDVLDRFQSALPPGKWSIPMYLRPSGTVGTKPQGSCLFQSLQGSCLATLTGVTLGVAFASTTEATMVLSGIDIADFPHVGVVGITNGTPTTEYVRYTGYIAPATDATIATFTGCTRGYASSTAATGTVGNGVVLSSPYYRQTTTSPSISIWIETDHLVQGLQGASVSEAAIDVTNEGAVKLTLSGEGMNMVWAGTSTMVANAATTATIAYVGDANLFSVDAWVHCASSGTNARQIIAVDTTANTLLFDVALDHNWATTDTICGYLPTGTAIGDPVEAKDTSVEISGVSAKIKSGSLSIRAPKKYLSDEIGTDYAEDYLEDLREITSTLKLYFKKADAKYFADGMASDENSMHFQFGDTAGYIMDVYFPRAFLEVPTVEFNAPALELSIPMKAIGTDGEDSCEIVIC